MKCHNISISSLGYDMNPKTEWYLYQDSVVQKSQVKNLIADLPCQISNKQYMTALWQSFINLLSESMSNELNKTTANQCCFPYLLVCISCSDSPISRTCWKKSCS